MSEKYFEKLLEWHRNGQISRRALLGGAGSFALAAGVMGGPFAGLTKMAKAADMPESIRYDGWGGTVQEAQRKLAFDPFEEQTGIKVIEGNFTGGDAFLTQVKASQPGEYNVFSASGVFDYARYADLGYAVELNEDNIPNMKLVMPALMTSFREITNGSLSCAPYDYGATGIAYNRKHISDDEAKEKGAMLLLDSKFKGKIGCWNDWRTRAWYGALHTGQDPNDIQDTDAMWDALREHRELLLKYWSSGAELMSLLAEEEIYVTEGWSGRIATLQQQGHDIGYIYPEKGFAWQECKMVLKGSPMEAVELLLNFLLEPEVAIAVAEGQNYPPSLDPTQVDVGDKVASLPMFDPTGKLEGMTFAVPDYWNSRQADWSKQFSRIEKGF